MYEIEVTLPGGARALRLCHGADARKLTAVFPDRPAPRQNRSHAHTQCSSAFRQRRARAHTVLEKFEALVLLISDYGHTSCDYDRGCVDGAPCIPVHSCQRTECEPRQLRQSVTSTLCPTRYGRSGSSTAYSPLFNGEQHRCLPIEIETLAVHARHTMSHVASSCVASSCVAGRVTEQATAFDALSVVYTKSTFFRSFLL